MNATDPAATGDDSAGRSRAGDTPAADTDQRDDDREPPSGLTGAEGPAVDLIDATGALAPSDCDLVLDALARALAERDAIGEIRLRVVGDDEMAAAHGHHLGDPTTTDVLTFDLAEDPAGPLDVDALLCLDEARRSAEARGIPIAHELLLYALHAALHCLGFDDTDEDSSRAMHAEEDRLLEAIGVGAVYARGSSR